MKAVDSLVGAEPTHTVHERGVSVRVPAGVAQLRSTRRFWQAALTSDELALLDIVEAASSAAQNAAPAAHSFSAEFTAQAVLAARGCEPREALQAMHPSWAASSIPFLPTSWSQCKERIDVCLTRQPGLETTASPRREAGDETTLVLELIETWISVGSAHCFDCEHADIPGHDTNWSFAFMVQVPSRRLFLWLRGRASD